METMQLKEGALLQGGKYRIESVLGQGGFGITYMAVQTGLNRKVAIKEFFMKDLCNRDADTSHVSVPSVGSKELVEKFRIKFVKEAQTIAGLSHPNIIRIHDIFEENGTAYYVMEYHGSGSLADMDLPMPTDKALGYVRQIGSALDYLHSRNVMHLDVKPSNVLVDDASNAVLIDFGVSKRYDESGHQTSSTPVGISHGYAPIEQYSQTTLTFSPATDIYALGATLYKLLTGQTPPESSLLLSNPSLLSFPEDAPSSLVALVRKCMRPVVDDRPQSIEEFLGLLEAAAKEENERKEDENVVQEDHDETDVVVSGHGQTGDQSSGSISSHVPAPAPRKRRLWLWVTLIAAVVVGAVTYFIWPTGYEATGYENGHGYVDLGLPSGLKWATCNVGASSPEDYGDYYAWGEVSTKDEYSLSTCSTWEESIANISGNPRYDVARAKWGGSWRMPTWPEFQELIDKCTWEWTTKGDHNGYKVTGRNGNSIFLPAAGYRGGADTHDAESYGRFWSATPNESFLQHACYLDFNSGYRYSDWFYRYCGHSVRPVSE